MSRTSTETVPLSDGRQLRFTTAEPEHVVRGALVVLGDHAPGHDPTTTTPALANTLAGEGWLVVLPKLAADGHERLVDDFDAAGVWLADREVPTDRIGVLGFGVGGVAALAIAARRTIGAAVSVAAPGVRTPVLPALPALDEIVTELTCPWLGIYGDDDPSVSAEDLERMRGLTAANGVAVELVRFTDAAYRFDRDPDGCGEARHRALNWFDAHLR